MATVGPTILESSEPNMMSRYKVPHVAPCKETRYASFPSIVHLQPSKKSLTVSKPFPLQVQIEIVHIWSTGQQ